MIDRTKRNLCTFKWRGCRHIASRTHLCVRRLGHSGKHRCELCAHRRTP